MTSPIALPVVSPSNSPKSKSLPNIRVDNHGNKILKSKNSAHKITFLKGKELVRVHYVINHGKGAKYVDKDSESCCTIF